MGYTPPLDNKCYWFHWLVYWLFNFVSRFTTINHPVVVLLNLNAEKLPSLAVSTSRHSFAFWILMSYIVMKLKSLDCCANLWITTLVARFMGPTWGPSGADRTQLGPMLAPWTFLSGYGYEYCIRCPLWERSPNGVNFYIFIKSEEKSIEDVTQLPSCQCSIPEQYV